jgi:hypothetical protein
MRLPQRNVKKSKKPLPTHQPTPVSVPVASVLSEEKVVIAPPQQDTGLADRLKYLEIKLKRFEEHIEASRNAAKATVKPEAPAQPSGHPESVALGSKQPDHRAIIEQALSSHRAATGQAIAAHEIATMVAIDSHKTDTYKMIERLSDDISSHKADVITEVRMLRENTAGFSNTNADLGVEDARKEITLHAAKAIEDIDRLYSGVFGKSNAKSVANPLVVKLLVVGLSVSLLLNTVLMLKVF